MSFSHERYVELLKDLLSGDAVKLRAANRELYMMTVQCDTMDRRAAQREADLALAEIAR